MANPLLDYSFEETAEEKPARREPARREPERAPASSNPLFDYKFEEAGYPKDQYKTMGYGEVAGRALKAFPESAVTTAKSMIEPFYPENIPQTAVNLGQLGYGAASKARGALGYEEEPSKKASDEAVINAVISHYKDKYGSTEGFKKAFAEDPVGVLADIGGVATGAGRLPGMAGAVGRAVQSATLAPFTAPLKAAKTVAGVVPSTIMGGRHTASGLSSETLQAARQSGHTLNPAFWESASGAVTPEQVVKNVRNTINDVVKERSENYLSGMADINARNDILPFNAIENALLDARRRAYSGPEGIEVDPNAAAAIMEATQKVNEFKRAAAENPYYQTMEGFDDLKKALDRIGDKYVDPASKDIISNARNAAKQTIASKDPRYADIMDEYANASKDIREFEKELIARSQGQTTGRDLRALLRAQKNPYKKELLDELEARNPDIGAHIAGQELAQAHSPRLTQTLAGGLMAGVGVKALPALAMTVPSIAAKTAYGMGRLERPFKLPGQWLESMAPTSLREPMPSMPELSTPGVVAGQTKLQQPIEGNVSFMPEEDRTQRASGGRVGMTAQKLLAQLMRAHKISQEETKPLLEQPDEAVAKALAVANENI
jgi:hypothetical protein